MPRSGRSRELHEIHDADDRRVDGRVGVADGGHGGKTFLNCENPVADAGIDSVQRNDRITDGLLVEW